MFFDKQALYLVLLFASTNVLGAPLSLPAIEDVSVEQPAGISASANLDTVYQTAKNSRSPSYNPVASNAILSGHRSDVTNPQPDARASAITINSASATASPSPSFLTSPNLNDLRLSLPKATQYSTLPGNVDFESFDTGHSQKEINMALPPEPTAIIALRDTSPAASSVGLLGTIESLITSVYSEVAGTSASVAASSGAASSSQAVLTSSVSQTASDSVSPTPTTTNALSILFSALPSSIADPLQSAFKSEISAIAPADQSSTSHTQSPTNKATHKSTGRPTRTNRPTNHPTKNRTSKPTSSPTTLHKSTHTSTATQTDPIGQAHPTGPPSIGSHPISNASIAGIVAGLFAAFVIAGLATIFVLRRRKQGKPVFGGLGRGGSKRSTGSGPYPAVAWLYDPKMSEPGTQAHSRSGSIADGAEERLIPEPRPGSAEMAGGEAPHLPPARPSSPLLAPHMPPARDRSPSPGRGRNRASSNASDSSPFLQPVHEE